MKKLIIGAVVLIVLFIAALNSGFFANQAVAWVKENPKDPNAPEVLYRAARWCDMLGDDEKAVEVYWMLYEKYPEQGNLVAPALYYCADIRANGSNIVGLRRQALPYIEIIMNQYSAQEEWRMKAKQLYDEVNYVR